MLRYPTLPDELQGGMNWRMLRYFGAGAIIASVTIGSGETLFASRAGAVFGYTLLWCFVFGAIMKGVQAYTGARHMVLTGEHPMEHWGRLPGPRNWIPIVIGALSLACFPFWLAGLPRILGEMINWIFGLAPDNEAQFVHLARIWATIAILVAITITWIQTYHLLEKVQTIIIGLLLLSLAAACLASRPDWLAALTGTVVPMVPDYQPWILDKYTEAFSGRTKWVEMVLYLGVIGGGTYDYLGYISFYREKKWGAIGTNDGNNPTPNARPLTIDTTTENVLRARRWLIPVKIDVGISFGCVALFSVFFVVLAAAIMHPQELAPAGRALFNHQAQFLTNFHPGLLYLYQAGVFMAFWGTIYGAYELYSRTAYECLRPLSTKFRGASIRQVRAATLAYTGIGGLILLWTTDNPIKLVTWAGLIGGVFTCGLWCFLMIWTDRLFLPRPLRMRWPLLVMTVLSGTVLTALGVKAIYDKIISYL